MVEAKSLRKALIPPSLLPDPSPSHLQSTRLALHLNGGASSCSAFVASACRIYKIEVMCGRWRESEKALSFRGDSNWLGFSKISMEDSTVSKGKESLLIPVHAQVITALFWVWSTRMATLSYLDWIQLLLAFIFSTASDCGIGEGSWAGICFRPIHWSTVAVARSFCKSIDVYDPDIHLRNLRTWSAMSRWVNCSKYEITGLSFSSIDSAYIYVQGVDYEVMCGRWRESEKALSFRGDSNLLGFSKLVRRVRAECGYHLRCFCYCTPDWRNYTITTEAASNINEQQRTCWASERRGFCDYNAHPNGSLK